MSQIPNEIVEVLSKDSTQITFKENPHRDTTHKHAIFQSASKTNTVGEAKAQGASLWDLKEWYKKHALEITSLIIPMQVHFSHSNQSIPLKQEIQEPDSSNLKNDR